MEAPSVLRWTSDLHAQPTVTSSLPAALTRQLEGLARETCESQRLPALLAAVTDADGAVLWQWRSGVVATAPPRRADPTLALRIGSISKTMTAVLVLQLSDEGRLALDDDVNAHLTSMSLTGAAGQVITVRHLLTHTAGLDAESDVGLGCAPGEERTVPAFYGPRLVSQSPAGDFCYSNAGFAVLGQLVEDVVGRPLAERARESLFDWLGMRSTSYLPDPFVIGSHFAGFDRQGEDLIPTPLLSIIPLGAGSVWSTLADMTKYASFMHGRGANAFGRPLSADAFAELIRPQPRVTGLPSRPWADSVAMCLGWLELRIAGTRVWWHNGGWFGARSELAVIADHGLTVMLFSNAPSDVDLDPACAAMVSVLTRA